MDAARARGGRRRVAAAAPLPPGRLGPVVGARARPPPHRVPRRDHYRVRVCVLVFM